MESKVSRNQIGQIFKMMMAPTQVIKSSLEELSWYFSLGVSGLAFFLFFLLTGLDLLKSGQKGILFVLSSSLLGLAYGIVAVPLLGILSYLFMKLFKSQETLVWTVKSVCLSFSGALIYGLVGLVFSLFFSWRVSIAFGVTGVLWAIGPMFYTFRRMSNNNLAVSLILSTIIGSIVLYTWSYFGRL